MRFAFCFLTAAFAVGHTLASEQTRQTGKILGKGKKKAIIELSQPTGGWTLERMVRVAGHVDDPTVDPITISINGDRYLLRTKDGRFDRQFPVVTGKNSITVMATNQAGSSQAERTLYSSVPPVQMMAVLTSDTDGVYTDLHIYEPSPTLKDPYAKPEAKDWVHVYWADTSSPSGGKFYLNEQGDDYDQPGYGPYLYTHTSPPLGIYRIDANYWPSGDKAHTLAYLNLTLFGGTPQELKRTVQYPLAKPGETVTLAWIRVDKALKGYIYAPTEDPKPNANVWPSWVIESKK